MIQDKKSGFNWKLALVYGSPYEKGKQASYFYGILARSSYCSLVGGNFNLIRFASDKIMLGLVINGLMLSMSGFISGSC